MSRISPGTVLLAFFAILCGLFGVFLVTRPRTVAEKRTARQVQQITVPVASSILPAGRRITMGDIALLKLTREEIKERDITGGFMASTQHIIGRVLKQELPLGKTFRTSELYPEGFGPGIGEKLTAGHRAVTVPLGNDDAILGFATADSWVDVIFRSGGGGDNDYRYSNDARYRNGFSSRYNNSRGSGAYSGYGGHGGSSGGNQEITTTLLQRVRVLAIDRNTLQAAADKRPEEEMVSVTLEVRPEQAEKLRVVEGRGQLSLALRADDDMDVQKETKQQTLDDILGFENRVHEMKIYEHTRMNVLTFEQRRQNRWASNRRSRRFADADDNRGDTDSQKPQVAEQTNGNQSSAQ